MKCAIIIGLLFARLTSGAAPATPAMNQPASGVAPSHADPEQNALTNIFYPAQTVPDDVLPNIIARFPFDFNECPTNSPASAVPVMFKRNSIAYGDGRPFATNAPRLVKGKFGKGILLEESHANLLSRNQAAVEGTTTSSFVRLKGTLLSFATNEHWQGKQSLQVATPGTNGEEGVAIATVGEQALYDGNRIVPAHYVASVYLKGSGALMLSLTEPAAGMETEPVVIAMDKTEWKRFFCAYSASFPVKTIGPGHEADWKSLLPENSRIEVKLQFVCSTIDKQKTEFYADGFQLEQRALPFAAQGPSVAPRSWTPGGSTAAPDEFSFSTQSDVFAAWKKSGTISFWFKPGWDVRDGTQELMLDLGPASLKFEHAAATIRFQPAGVEFKPYDWKDNWHHIAIAWNQEGRRALYLDGYDYLNPQGETLHLPAATAILTLSQPGHGAAPNGIVDDLILFQGELSLDQIKAIAAYEPIRPRKPRKSGEQSTSNAPVVTNAP